MASHRAALRKQAEQEEVALEHDLQAADLQPQQTHSEPPISASHAAVEAQAPPLHSRCRSMLQQLSFANVPMHACT